MVPDWVTKFIFFKFRFVINSATGWTVRGSNPGRGKRFFSPKRPDRHWSTPSLLFRGYRGSCLGVKRPGHEVNHPFPCNAEVKN